MLLTPTASTNNVIVSMYLDHEQKLWIGTYFGGLDCFDGKNFKHYRHNDADPAAYPKTGYGRYWKTTRTTCGWARSPAA
jgi:hypothetical protein